MTATERLRAMLDERGVEWWQSANTIGCIFTRWHSPLFGDEVYAMENGEEGLVLFDHFLTPEQAIAATLGDSVATGERQGVAKVYLVEVSDELLKGWCPISVCLHKESAEDCAESYRREYDGVRQFARVVEMKVEDA